MKQNRLFYMLAMAFVFLSMGSCKSSGSGDSALTDEALLDTVQRTTFNYFWDGAEPTSGLACERIHLDGEYSQNDQNVVTSGGSGFGIMAILAGIDRGYVSREAGFARMEKIVSFLETCDRFHGAYPHWWYGDTGKVKPFSKKDDGGIWWKPLLSSRLFLPYINIMWMGRYKRKHWLHVSTSCGARWSLTSIVTARMCCIGTGAQTTRGI